MVESAVWILAGVTLWCVASLMVALIVGPVLRAARERRELAAPVAAGAAVEAAVEVVAALPADSAAAA